MDLLILVGAILVTLALFVVCWLVQDLRLAIREVLDELEAPALDDADLRGHLAGVEAELAASRGLIQDTNDIVRTSHLRLEHLDTRVADLKTTVEYHLAPPRK